MGDEARHIARALIGFLRTAINAEKDTYAGRANMAVMFGLLLIVGISQLGNVIVDSFRILAELWKDIESEPAASGFDFGLLWFFLFFFFVCMTMVTIDDKIRHNRKYGNNSGRGADDD